MSDKSRRKLLKSIAAGSGAIVAGKSLPESWSRPVIDSVMLPAHAQTSGLYTQNQNTDPCTGFPSGTPDPTVINFVISSPPTGDGTLEVTAIGDLGAPTEFFTVTVEGDNIGQVGPNGTGGASGPADNVPVNTTLNIPLSVLLAAAADGTISITFTPSGEFDCGLIDGNFILQYDIDATLSFPT